MTRVTAPSSEKALPARNDTASELACLSCGPMSKPPTRKVPTRCSSEEFRIAAAAVCAWPTSSVTSQTSGRIRQITTTTTVRPAATRRPRTARAIRSQSGATATYSTGTPSSPDA